MVTPSKILAPPGVSVNSRSTWIIQEFAGSPSTSTNFDILARFQQRQLQEKEQKLLQLYDQQQQRAHQVALRGSAGSSDSHGSSHGSLISNPAGKVRQMFDERRQNTTRGIDKSYPLDPLEGKARKQAANNRRSLGTRRAIKTDAGVGTQQKDNVSRESYASNRGDNRETTTIQRENVSRESHAANRSEETAERPNGHEMNIDEMISDEAMQRNRMLAKFQPSDRNDVADETTADVVDASPTEKTTARRLSQAERIKNASPRKANATPATRKAAIPKGANSRQSTFMKTTKSASLKIRKLPRNRKIVEDRKSSNQAKKKSKKQISVKQRECCCEHRKSSSASLGSLKSTPLVCEIIRNQKKNIRSSDANLIGKVKTIIKKMENMATEMKHRANALSKFSNDAESTNSNSAEQKKESEPSGSPLSPTTRHLSIIGSDECKKNVEEVAKVSPDKSEQEAAKSTADKHACLTSQQDADAPTSRGQRKSSLEPSTDHQEITIADQTIKIDNKDEQDDRCRDYSRRASGGYANHARRASFELKRMVFERPESREQNPSRRDSVESALRHFDSIDVGSTDSWKDRAPASRNVAKAKLVSDRLASRLCTKNSPGKNATLKGFERHTSAWLMKTSKEKVPEHPRGYARETVTEARRIMPKRKAGFAVKMNTSAKLLAPRDSIELARLSVKARSTGSRRRGGCDPKCARIDNGEALVVKSQSFLCNNRAVRLKSIISNEFVPKIALFLVSTTKNSTADSSVKKADAKDRDFKAKKNAGPLSSSKSSEDASEEKAGAPAKSASLRFLNQIVGEAPGENGVRRKSNVSGIDALNSVSTVPKDEKETMPLPTTPRKLPVYSVAAHLGAIPSLAEPTTQLHKKLIPRTLSGANRHKALFPLKSDMPDVDLYKCKSCGRRFSKESLMRHEPACITVKQRPRKKFDPVQHRAKGTELESFLKTANKKQQNKSDKAGTATEPSYKAKSNWRRKHEDFINTIRSAKQMQAHLNAGGKLSDLPPPPPSDTSDYVQCPHCSRRFNQGAASRHIPLCSSMQHNKSSSHHPGHRQSSVKSKH